jgi:hypothetical protein
VAVAPVAGISVSLLGADGLLALTLGLMILLAVGWFWPYRALQLVLWFLTHSIYWLRVRGREHVPARGGALLICNHVRYLDWLLLPAAQGRFIRMVVFAGWTRQWGVRHLLRWAGVIAIDGSTGPRGLARALREARACLARGDHSRLSRSNARKSFRRRAGPAALALAGDAAVSGLCDIWRAAAGGNAGRRCAAGAAALVRTQRHRALGSTQTAASPLRACGRPPSVPLLFLGQHPP